MLVRTAGTQGSQAANDIGRLWLCQGSPSLPYPQLPTSNSKSTVNRPHAFSPPSCATLFHL